MGILNDLVNLNFEKLTIKDLEALNSRGAYPIVKHGQIKGFVDEDGVPLIMY